MRKRIKGKVCEDRAKTKKNSYRDRYSSPSPELVLGAVGVQNEGKGCEVGM